MAVGKEGGSRLWADGQFTVRLKNPGQAAGRVIRIRRPFAVVGRLPGADVPIDDPAVEPRHAFLILDRRGLFGVDLLTETGTRFAGAAIGSSWLGPGDIVEIAGRRLEILQLRVDGQSIDPPLSTDDPLAEAHDAPMVGLTLEPLDAPAPPWMLGSALAFLGRGDACAIRVENASASKTHCALIRGSDAAFVVDLIGRRTLLNDRPVEGASAMVDGDILTVGQARFAVRVDQSGFEAVATGTELARFDGNRSGLPATGPQDILMSVLMRAASNLDAPSAEVADILRRFQSDTATLLTAQLDRIEALQREIISLRDEVRSRPGRPPVPEPAPPLNLDLASPTPGPPSAESATWLLDRLNGLEQESRSTWKDLLGKITATVAPKPDQSIVPAGRKP